MRKPTLSDILREVGVAPQMHDRLARIMYALGGGTPPIQFNTTPGNAVGNAAETIIVSTPPFNPGSDATRVLLLWSWSTNSVGTAGTAIQMSVRRGTALTSPQVVGPFDVGTVVAANQFANSIIGVDTPGAVAGVQYSGTVFVANSTNPTNSFANTLVAIAFG